MVLCCLFQFPQVNETDRDKRVGTLKMTLLRASETFVYVVCVFGLSVRQSVCLIVLCRSVPEEEGVFCVELMSLEIGKPPSSATTT